MKVSFPTVDCLLGFGLFNDAVSSPDCITSNDRLINEQWIRKEMEGSGRGFIWGSIQVIDNLFASSYWAKPRKTSVRKARLRAEIWIQDLTITKQDWYNHSATMFVLLRCDTVSSSSLHWLGSQPIPAPIFSLVFLSLDFPSVYTSICLLLLIDDSQAFCSDVDTV
jgi:hypothetical protein